MEFGATTLREIYEQPEVWRQSLKELKRLDLEPLLEGMGPRSHEWLFVGCGTSYHLAQAAATTLTNLVRVPARAVPASEILLFPNPTLSMGRNAVLPVLISRSGNTSEVLQVAEILRQRGIEFLAVTCDGNKLARLTPRIVKLPVDEHSTVMTASFTSMLLALQFIAAKFAGQEEFIRALHELPDALASLFDNYGLQVKEFAQQSFENAAFLAQGPLYPIASEVSLKVMESSSTFAQYFYTLEFRHGPKSIVTDKVLVGTLLSDAGYVEESAVLQEMKELGGRTLAIANRITPEVAASADLAIELGLPVPELARLVVYVVWGQLLGSYLGLYKGLNPDTPRNLTRTVTLAE